MVDMRLCPGTVLAAALAGAMVLAGAPVRAEVFVTARGARVMLPAIGSLDCVEMRNVLVAIDGTGYRGTGPEPLDPADRRLLEYENRLSSRYYQTCVHGSVRAGSPPDVFARGYAFTE